MQEFRFSSSMIAAIDFALLLVQGKLQNWQNPLPAPTWTNFRFFGDIHASAMRRIERLRGDGGDYEVGWRVERAVSFRFRGEVVLEVMLGGEILDRKYCAGITPNKLSSWAVKEVRYAVQFDGRQKPKDWIERRLPEIYCTQLA
ncbi:MAG: hypothetical protein AAB871_03190 [Patescibacteria group bacterium]